MPCWGGVIPPGPRCNGLSTKPRWRSVQRWWAGPRRRWKCAWTTAKHGCNSGVQIGGFQAVKHKIADMKVWVENAKSVVYYAAWALDSEAPEASQSRFDGQGVLQ